MRYTRSVIGIFLGKKALPTMNLRKTSPVPSWLLALLLIAGIAAISFSSIFVRWSDAPVSVMGMYRLLFTNLLMLPFALWRLPEIRRLTIRDCSLVILSGVMLCLHFLLWMNSLRFTSIASSTVLLSLEPVFVLAGAYWLYRERTTRKAVAGMCASIAGAVMIGWGDIGLSASALQGDLLSLLGTAAVAVHMLLGQALAKRISSFVYSFFVFLTAALLFLAYNAFAGYPLAGYSAQDWGIFALLAVVPTVFGHILFNWLLQYMNAATISMSVLGEPVGSTLLACVLLGEKLALAQAAAGLVIIGGVWYFLRHNRVTYASRDLAEAA